MLRKHVVRQGDTLLKIVRRYGIKNLEELMEYNPLLKGKPLQVGIAVYLPLPFVHHRVQRGETLVGIATKYNRSVQELFEWNENPFLEFLVAGETVVKIPQFRFKRHEIRRGETATTIARSYGIAVGDLLALNPGIDPNALEAGLTVFLPDEPFQVANPEGRGHVMVLPVIVRRVR